ncbi:hypothetical protein ACFLZP_03685 [Patescibacteria group bacterium]
MSPENDALNSIVTGLLITHPLSRADLLHDRGQTAKEWAWQVIQDAAVLGAKGIDVSFSSDVRAANEILNRLNSQTD